MTNIRRPPAVTGKPSIPVPANNEVNSIAQLAGQVRARLDALDAAVNKAFSTLDASTQAQQIESQQTQITALTKRIEILAKSIEALSGKKDSSQTIYVIDSSAEDGQDAFPIPGPPGPVGPPGPAIVIPGDDGETAYFPLPT